MAIMELRSYPAEASGGFLEVIFNLRGDNMPKRRVEVKNLADVECALTAFKSDVARLGMLAAVSTQIVEGRSPSGYREWSKRKYYHRVDPA